MISEFQPAKLGSLIDLANGRSSPQRTERGRWPVYGSNGSIGRSEDTNSPAQTIVIGRVGTYCGSVYFSPTCCWVTDNAIRGTAKAENCGVFLYYLLKHLNLNNWRSGSGQPLLNQSTLNNIDVNVPSPNVQREIGAILSALDARIALLRETNATLDAIAQTLFKSWFVDFDPVRAKQDGRLPEGMDEATAALFPDSFEETGLARRPKGWGKCAVYDLATYINGAAYKAFDPNLEMRGLPIIKIAELKAGVTSQTAYSDVVMPEKYRILTGDILFSWSGNPDTSIDTFVWPHGSAWLNQHIFRVVPHVQGERAFLLRTLKYLRPVFAELARNKQTTGLGHVTVADLKRLQVVKPGHAVIERFDRVVAPAHRKIFDNDQRVQTLIALRDTLLPRLISGQLRLPDNVSQIKEAA